MKRRILLCATALALLISPAFAAGTWHKSNATTNTEALFGAAPQNRYAAALKASAERANAPVTTVDAELPAASSFGTLDGPDGTTWTYTIDVTTSGRFYTSAAVSVYDAQQQKIGGFSTQFDAAHLPENVTGINSVQVNPLITQKFFNMDASYELMLYIHATTADYTGYTYNEVYSLTNSVDNEPIIRIPGNQVMAQNTAADAWSENYTMVFYRDSTSTDGNYYNCFDIYEWAQYGNGQKATCVHTFAVPYRYIESSGGNFFPIILSQRLVQGTYNMQPKPVYALAQYEKPFFTEESRYDETPQPTPDNNLVITLIDHQFDTISTTLIPCPTTEGYLYTFPYIGGLRYEEDFYYNDTVPTFIVTFDYYETASDDFLSSYYVYNVEGERINTIAELTSDNLWLSDVRGQESQFCFLYTSDENNTAFKFVNFPSCEEVLTIPTTLGSDQLSANLDRYPVGDSYQYAVSLSHGSSDDEGNTYHTIAWVNLKGEIDHYDRLNLGQDISLANPYINATALNPYLFNTDADREYMVLVKRLIDASGSAADEVLYVVNTNGERLLELGPDDEKGTLLTIMLLNADTDPALAVVYYNSADDTYIPTFVNLPLNQFAGGSGTEEDPYLIATAGDFAQIKNAPTSHFRVINDLDFGALVPFEGISTTFSGTLDGQDHILTNLVLDNNGLFTNIAEGGTVSNLQIYRPEIELESALQAGIVAGNIITAGTTVENIRVYYPVVTAPEDYSGYFGGIVGSASVNSVITQCFVSGAVFDLGNGTVGGIVGQTRTGVEVKACAFIKGLMHGNIAGGIVGETTTGDEKINNNHSDVRMVGAEAAGGIVGSNARAIITNCVADGELVATGSRFQSGVGGIAGIHETAYETTGPAVTIGNNLVGVTAITSLPDEGVQTEPIAHRIVGQSSGDEKTLDWDAMNSWTQEEWDAFYAGEKEGIYIYGAAETTLKSNYVYSDLAVINANIEAKDTTVEGATILAADLTSEFLTGLNFAAGTTVAAPWVHSANPHLWYETTVGDLVVDKSQLNLIIGDSTSVTFTIINGDAEQLKIEIDKPEVLSSYSITYTDDDQVTYYVAADAKGTAVITATYGDKTATVTVVCDREHLQYDAEDSDIEQTYTDDDQIAIDDLSDRQGFKIFTATKADNRNKVLIYFYEDDTDEINTIPEGTYDINGTKAQGTVQASTGVGADGVITPSYYATLNSDGSSSNAWFFVDGTVEVKTVDGVFTIEVNAINSYDQPIHITYSATATALPGTETDTLQAEKFFHNGQLYIRRNGTTYSVSGAVVE